MERIWKEVVKACFDILLSQHLPGETKENYGIPQSEQLVCKLKFEVGTSQT
jgi:hypothetical protein